MFSGEIGGIRPETQSILHEQTLSQVDFSKAKHAYQNATNNPQERHAEVGILSSAGIVTFERLGKNEQYGAHRVGSVTKTFTAFLAMKLAKDNVLPNGLKTKCKDVISHEMLSKVFENPKIAGEMTLEQLLSHTSGLEFDDHSRPQDSKASSLQERFLQEPHANGGRKYIHMSEPGEGVGFYSNAGLAVAGWVMEAAYNKHYETFLPFSQIMKEELFEKVFELSESFIGPGPTNDIIQSAAGDMTSSTPDLIKVAACLQKGETDLEPFFGVKWQSEMLKPRDLFQHHGLGCSANASVIQHAGMNREKVGLEERDVTALVEFPLRPEEPGLVAMCDSCALGPAPQEQNFIKELEKCAGIFKSEEAQREPTYDLDFFCPEKAHLFHGNAYLATDVDPFSKEAPEKIVCSRNGMKHELNRDPSVDGIGIRGYKDENGGTWLCISKEDGRKIIYSGMCLLTSELSIEDINSKQPSLENVKALEGVYRDSEAPNEHPTYTFYEKNGRLYMRDGNEKDAFPCLYIPNGTQGGSWVVSNPSGRSIQIQFPSNLEKENLVITDIYTSIQQLPHNSKRVG